MVFLVTVIGLFISQIERAAFIIGCGKQPKRDSHAELRHSRN